jgi:triacylglycerol lipase
MYQFPMYFPKGFDASRAEELARLCKKSYDLYDQQAKPRWFKPVPPPPKFIVEGYSDVTGFFGGFKVTSIVELAILFWAAARMKRQVRPSELFGFVARRGDDVFLVFRGTQSMVDWLGDVHMRQVPIGDTLRPEFTRNSAAASIHWQGARLEQGVHSTYVSMRDVVLALVKAQDKPGRRLFVTGHSLGAGLAIASIPDLLKNTKHFSKIALYTFAGPRVANREFALAVLDHNVDCYRVVHVEDMVPTLPPPVPIGFFKPLMQGKWFYSHVGTPVDFGRAWTPTDTPDISTNHCIETHIEALEQVRALSAISADVAVLPVSGTPARV